MLRLIVNILILLLVVRLLRPLFEGFAHVIKGRDREPRVGGSSPAAKAEDYSDLTDYEIEDADYEEVRRPAD